jgi:hypothetical protein
MRSKKMRQADKTKGGYLNVKARTVEEEQKIKNIKILGVRDSVPYVDLVFEAIDMVLAKHRFFRGGNPQLELDSPLLPVPVLVSGPKCKCGEKAVKFGLHLPSKKEFVFCQRCFSEVPVRYDVGVWSWKK